MKRSLFLYIIFAGVTLPVALCLPSRQPNDLEILTAGERHRLTSREGNEPTRIAQGSRKQRRWRKLSIRAAIDDDEPTPEEPDDFFDDDEIPGRTARAGNPTMEEIQWFLSPKEQEDFRAVRLERPLYEAALDVAKEAKAAGRKLTKEEENDLAYGQKRVALYNKLRYNGVKRLVERGKARPEVKKYWEDRMAYYRKNSALRLASMTPEQRKAYSDGRKARYQNKKADRAALEERIADGTAGPKDRQKWEKIQQAEADAAAEKERVEELERKVDQKIPLDEDEAGEWEAILAQRKRKVENTKAYRERKKQGIKSREGSYRRREGEVQEMDPAAEKRGRGRPRKDTTDTSKSQPLQISVPPDWSAGTRPAQSRNIDKSSGGFDLSTMGHGVVARIGQMRDNFLTGLGHVMNKAGSHSSMGPFVGGEPPIIKVPTGGGVPIFS
ncbi:MAG: hypothetical protein M1816_003037 [Peltula sp. TS41687]|nr:MAG: hypothetical protein M1816_003037 [Peltula sp. TS41687]